MEIIPEDSTCNHHRPGTGCILCAGMPDRSAEQIQGTSATNGSVPQSTWHAAVTVQHAAAVLHVPSNHSVLEEKSRRAEEGRRGQEGSSSGSG